ncbi:MAG: ABC transporter substrate-binding protein [Sneathiella sp.]|nr:ABC transporter substrate-binding protein [Sneathiella sp.]
MFKSKIVQLAFLMLGISVGFQNPAYSDDRKVIYSVYWSGCEEACQGLKDYLKAHNLEADLIIRDVERDKSKLPQFVAEARKLKADVVVTWGTSTTLGMTGTLDDQGSDKFINKIPVVFTMVSDPIRSRIIKSYDKTGRSNITGTRNRVPEALNIKTLRKIKPDFQRLGILYNSNEPNSVSKVKEITDLQKSLNFELIALELKPGKNGKPDASDIEKRVAELKEKKTDFIYLGSSAFLEQNMDIFTAAAVKNGLPVLSPYENLVRESQAYLSIAARDYDVGTLAGQQIQKILVDKQKPGDISVKSIDRYAYVINMTTAKKINLFPPVSMLQIAEIVE